MSTPEGWYDDGSGRQRWWDGVAWTENFADQAAQKAGLMARAMDSTSSALSSLTSKQDPSTIEGTLWSAVGKPLTGMGAGRYRVTQEFLVFEKGTISTKSQQIRMREIHDVDAKQSMSQKARGVGTITLHVIRSTGNETVLLEDIPNFREGVEIINRLSDEARHRHTANQNTSHVNYSGAPVVPAQPAPVAAPVAAGGMDLNAELARLATFHQQGILTDEEFSAGKRQLLGI